MRYKSFRIRGYKGIKKDIVIDLEKHSLLPLIGINECGKTTILEAILCFDSFNDTINNGRHLEHVENMYSTLDNDIKIEAKTEFEFHDLVEVINEIENEIIEKIKNAKSESQNEDGQKLESIKIYKDYFQELTNKTQSNTLDLYIGRDLKTRRYYFLSQKSLENEDLNNELASELMRLLPYTLYFDDFRDRLDEKIEIPEREEGASDWINIINKLFKLTNKSYSIFELPSKNENIRRSILSEVEIKLNEELLKEWPHFSIQQNQPLQIKISHSNYGKKNYLEFLIVEKIFLEGKERERYFKVQDRSKGFYWYFNFVMKLIFNTKTRDFHNNYTIYLLDEPGSYLHSTAQFRLTKRLRDISKKNKIIYCTHSPYLLDPQIIPLNSIRIVEKGPEGSIELKSVFDTKGKINKKNSAFQPIFDALDIKPILMDYDIDNIALVEGMYDYLSFEMFKDVSKLHFFPCINADSILNNISYMIFLKKNYLAIWDHDNAGIEQKKRAEKYFGESEAKKFKVLPLIANKKKSRLENLFDQQEITNYKENFKLAKNQSFEKTILHIFYSEKRISLLIKYFPKTQKQFSSIIADLELCLKENGSPHK